MRYDWSPFTRRWLGRFSFSFLIVGFFLAWEGYKRYTLLGGRLDWRAALYLLAAMLSLVLGMVGVRERHRRDDHDQM